MELITNRVRYKCNFNNINIIVSKKPEELAFSFKWEIFKERFGNNEKLIEWSEKEQINSDARISYEFSKDKTSTSYLILPLVSSFRWKCSWFLIGEKLASQNFLIDYNPKGVSLSCYKITSSFNNDWDKALRIDFALKFDDHKKIGEATLNFGSRETLISKNNQDLKSDYSNVRLVLESKRVVRSKYLQLKEGRLIANKNVLDIYGLILERKPINYANRYQELNSFYQEHLRQHKFDSIEFISTGFESGPAQKVSFDRNLMVFKNGNKDINPITGMRNFGVFKQAPHAAETKFLFIFENNDDANNLYKYLKNGYRGFPGLERYVDVPLVLANSIKKGEPMRLQYKSIETLENEYQVFEETELIYDIYTNYFAIIIGDFDKDNPTSSYYNLKLRLLKKGIPSQFINHKNIRKSSVFNYHLPNIAIGIHAKLGGVPWRIDSNRKDELVIGFNQDFNKSKQRFLAGSVFFDNHGNLKRTFSFPEKESDTEMISELRNAVNSFLSENKEIERLVIHFHKSLSRTEKSRIERLLRSEFQISIPYAVVEVNDTKSTMEMAFDPNANFGMPTSGAYLRLSNNEYLLFNNNRYKEIAPVNVKDELPVKIRIHFADESGFSHKELIEQVYEFSRLIWKGLKQRSQPATCFYAKEIARFRANSKLDIPENEITQTTPWVI